MLKGLARPIPAAHLECVACVECVLVPTVFFFGVLCCVELLVRIPGRNLIYLSANLKPKKRFYCKKAPRESLAEDFCWLGEVKEKRGECFLKITAVGETSISEDLRKVLALSYFWRK